MVVRTSCRGALTALILSGVVALAVPGGARSEGAEEKPHAPAVAWRLSMEGAVYGLAFSPDGKMLAAADVDDKNGRVSVWKLEAAAGR